MARVRFLVAVAGPDVSIAPGQVIEMADAEAAKWCDGVRAERVAEESKPDPKKPKR